MGRYLRCLVAAHFVAGASIVCAADESRRVVVAVGEAVRLGVETSDTEAQRFAPQHNRSLQLFANGYCFGITPGPVQVQSDKGTRFDVEVVAEQNRSVSAESFRQYPDNREFVGRDGRQCFGSELNCRMPQSKGTRSNRIVNPNPLSEDRDGNILWAASPGAPLLDGTGAKLGTLLPRVVEGKAVNAIKVQHGMTKVLNGEVNIYAFSTPVRLTSGASAGTTTGVSAWMPLRLVRDKEALLERLHPGIGRLPVVELSPERFTITGGNPADYDTSDGLPLKIVKAVHTPPQPHDYLLRPAGTINLLYAVPGFGLGGHSLDSCLVANKPVFRAAKGVRPITVPTYYHYRHPLAGQIADKTMTFVYGAVEANGAAAVYGWMAREALAPTPAE